MRTLVGAAEYGDYEGRPDDYFLDEDPRQQRDDDARDALIDAGRLDPDDGSSLLSRPEVEGWCWCPKPAGDAGGWCDVCGLSIGAF